MSLFDSSLGGALQTLIQNAVNSMKLDKVIIGKVVSVSGSTASVMIETNQQAIKAAIPEHLREKLLKNITHKHSYSGSDSNGDSYSGETAEALADISFIVNGSELGKKEQNLIVNKGIGPGDSVYMIRYSGGERFLIVGRM